MVVAIWGEQRRGLLLVSAAAACLEVQQPAGTCRKDDRRSREGRVSPNLAAGERERTKGGEGCSGPGDVREMRLLCVVLEGWRVQRSSCRSWRMVEEWGIGKEELRRRRLVEVWLGIGKDLRLVRKTMIREKRENLSREREDKWSKRCIIHGPPLSQDRINASMATPNNTQSIHH
jgi:hypothetical protein